jgi:SAM-dependent methyltransferase
MNQFQLCAQILTDLGVNLSDTTKILDWGCGAGEVVSHGRAAGFQAFGCDFDTTAEHCSRIESPYRLPYPDAHFDVVISNQVLEHVMDYDSSLAELARVLKPGGAFLHMFPSRWIPIEPHVFVPFATVIRNRAWLALWALLGVRNQFQRRMPALERARTNHAYLLNHTNYLTRRSIEHYFSRHFGDVKFVERSFLRHSPRARAFASVPFADAIYSTFRGRVLFGLASWRGQVTE